VDDKNVMPEEMVHYAHDVAGLRGLVRMGGDLERLKRLVAAGFPVIVEKGHTTTGWIGHYVLLTGYDDAKGHFLSQDSLIKTPNSPVPYAELVDRWWRHFNYLYLVIYPPEREAELRAALGPHAGLVDHYQAAAERARQEIAHLEGRELFFAWHNLGSSLTGLGEYAAAAQAYDTAYAGIYPTLPRADRPWRTLWYMDEPYQAYHAVGRYSDVIRMADATLEATGASILEETFYWRGRAREALGDQAGAVADYRTAAQLNPNSTPALDELRRLGEEVR
jgi:tetratricopeptide (TPR) repeat protein